jgi:hypothetical protein
LGVILALVCVCCGIIFLMWRRHRRRLYKIEGFQTLTYANPTYQKTSTETINSSSSADHRSVRSYHMFRYNSSQVKKHFICEFV